MATRLDGLLTPGGRLVMGSLTNKNDKDYDGRPIPADDQRYFYALAVPKNDPAVQALVGQLYQLAVTDFGGAPVVMSQINQGLAARDFSWKISDGDVPTVNRKTGQPNDIPDHIAGNYIFKFTSKFEIDACNAQGQQIGLGDIKVGDYCDILFNATTNGQFNDKAGIYLNPTHIRLLGYGNAITQRVSAADAFSAHKAVVPAGASSMPQATGGMPGAVGNGAATVAQGMPQHGMGNAAIVAPGVSGMPVPGASADPTHALAQTNQVSAAGLPGMPGAGQGAAQAPTASPHHGILNGPAGNGGGMPGM